GNRLAFTLSSPGGSEIDTYDIALRSRSRLQTESGQIDQLAWSPNQAALAYRLTTTGSPTGQIRVRSLVGRGNTTTLVSGAFEAPKWQSDSQHLFVKHRGNQGDDSSNQIYRIGSGQNSLITSSPISLGDEQFNLTSFAVSPDGRQMVLLTANPRKTELWLMNSDGTGLRPLNDNSIPPLQQQEIAVSWTPT
ncbi:MAG: TolB family protein, partial [Candidatus Dormibacteraceae bacterium]